MDKTKPSAPSEPAPTEPTPKPRVFAPKQTMATVLVGPDKTPFMVHRDLLTYHSPFFRAALTGSFKEAEDKKISLDDAHSQIFEFAVYWLYYQKLPGTNLYDDEALAKAWTDPTDHGELRFHNLISLYILSDKYDFPALGRIAMDAIYGHGHHGPDINLPSLALVNLAFSKTPDDSPLRRFLVDYFCRYDKIENWVGMRPGEKWEYPEAFLQGRLLRYVDVSVRIRDGGMSAHYTLAKCDYHGHKTLQESLACKGWKGEFSVSPGDTKPVDASPRPAVRGGRGNSGFRGRGGRGGS